MVAVNVAWGPTGDHPSKRYVNQPYLMEVDVDLAKAAAKKGSALVATDILEVLSIPAGSFVLFAGLQVMEAVTGGSSDVTVDLGITGVAADTYVDGFDLDAATAGAYATVDSDAWVQRFIATRDTIDLLFASATTVPTAGKLRVYAYVLDVTQIYTPGVAKIGS